MIYNKIIHGDCLEVMREMPDKSIDLVLTDPPYGIGESKKVRSRPERVKQKNGNFLIVPHKHKIKDWDLEIPRQDIFDEIFRISKNQIIFGENYLIFSQKGISSGRIFWDKCNGDSDFSDGEMIWISNIKSVRKVIYMWSGFCQGKSMVEGHIQQGDKKLNENKAHPSQKPIKLFEYLIQNYSNENDLILDCFSGSGTTAIACHNLNRRFICIEKDKEYYDKSVIRYEKHIQQIKLFA